jgi:hypothetical protein
VLTNNNPTWCQSPDRHESDSSWWRRRADDHRFRICDLRGIQPEADDSITVEPHSIKTDQAHTFTLHTTMKLLAEEIIRFTLS